MYVEMTAEQAHALVAKGATWLDARCAKWPNEIDLEIFNLREPDVCLLGQTHECLYGAVSDKRMLLPPGGRSRAGGGYWRVLRSELGADATGGDMGFGWAYEHGFAAMMNIEYEMLEIAWRQLIQARRAVKSVGA